MSNAQDVISITGGTGHLGFCLIQLLLERKFKVKALYHSKSPNLNHPNLIWIKGSLTDSSSLQELIQDSSALIHCASIISLGNQDEKKVYEINITGTERVVEVCKILNTKLVFISSSTAVEESVGNEVFNESRVYKTENDFLYSWTKAKSEQFILNAVKSTNLNALIIRPTAIVGPPDNNPSYFGQTIFDMQNGSIPVITSGGYNIVDVRDLSTTIINSLSKGLKGEVYLVGGNYLTIKNLAKMANPNRKSFCISIAFLINILPIIKLYGILFPLKWQITKESLITLKRAPKNVDSSKAQSELGHKIRPTSETIEDLLEWFEN